MEGRAELMLHDACEHLAKGIGRHLKDLQGALERMCNKYVVN